MYDPSSFKDRMMLQGGAMGKALKRQSDVLMDATFTRDIAYRRCYIQDKDFIFPEQTLEGYRKAKSVFAGKTKYNPEKISGFKPIDAKYLVHTYYSINKDTIDYFLQFRPNVHGTNENIRVGAFVFIPDDLGVYNLWLIVARDDRPQFPQFYVLRCDFLAKWHISEEDRVNYEGAHVDTGTYFSWSVARIQSSYNSGVWTDYSTTSVENQKKVWFPTNADTQTIIYNEHITISNNPLRRTSWEVTKVIDTEPAGLTKITLAQQLEYDARDNLSWVNVYSDEISDTQHGVEYDFFQHRTNDKEQHSPADEFLADDSIISFSGVKQNLKCGGSYKTYTANFYSGGKFIDAKPNWKIKYVVNDEVVCTVDFMYNEDVLVPCNDEEKFVISSDRKITYKKDGIDVFGIQYLYNHDKANSLKIKSLSILGMIGNKILIEADSAPGEPNNLSASIEVEVEGL